MDEYCWRPVTFEQWEFEKHSPESDVPHTGPSSRYCGIYPQTLKEHERSVRNSERSRALGKFKWYEDLSKAERVELWISERNMTMDQKLTTRHIWRAVKEGRVPEHLPTANERMKAFIDLLSKWCDESGLPRPDMRTPERRALDEARAARRAAAPPAPVRVRAAPVTMEVEGVRVCAMFPVRMIVNQRGKRAMWVPEEVMPSVVKRMARSSGLSVYRGSKGVCRLTMRGSWDKGVAKWAWSIKDSWCWS